MCQTTYYLLWNDSASMQWLPAMSLPILPWGKSFLPLLGLSNDLIQNLDAWTIIYSHAVTEEKRLQREEWFEGRRDDLLHQIVTEAFQKFSNQIGREIAAELELWVRRHFFCLEVEIMLRTWKRLLALACSAKNAQRISLPPALASLVPILDHLIGFEYQDRLRREIDSAAPPPPYEQDSYTRIDKCYEATMLSKATQQALTITALQTIAGNLNAIGIQEVVRWSLLQASALNPPINPVHLYGDKYLRLEPPCFDTPSILDLPTPKVADEVFRAL